MKTIRNETITSQTDIFLQTWIQTIFITIDTIDFAETSNPRISFFIKTTSFLDAISMSKVTAKIY